MNKYSKFVQRAKHLRKKGYSFEEIAKKFKISKSTAFYWTKNILLDKVAKERIRSRERIGLVKAKEIRRKKRENLIYDIEKTAKKTLLRIKMSKNLEKIICSILYWAEGAKTNKRYITFINSDPKMVGFFLRLFRSAFIINEKKFRGLVHTHEYHNERVIRKYWSKITRIPIKQFNKTYLKPNTKKRIRNNYQGTISIRYYDYQIAQEISFIYNMFAEKILGA